jgi:hypothetical protein
LSAQRLVWVETRLGPKTLHFGLNRSVAWVAQDWVDGGESVQMLVQAIIGCGFPALFWETPPVTAITRDQPFGFILQNSPLLVGIRPDPTPFQSQLTEGIGTFNNLGRDAVLVSPAPPGSFAHLAAFCRSAPLPMQMAFWRSVGLALQQWWDRSAEPVWVSTSGLGVYWLHVRLDARPKYYTHRPYRSVPLIP